MNISKFKKLAGRQSQPNLTPIVDIVFLLIIFFMLTFQFIVAENFPVAIPDKANTAIARQKENEKLSTLTITQDSNDVIFAVGGEQIIYNQQENLVEKLTFLLNKQLNTVKDEQKTVCLRIDRNITYRYTQIALAAVAQSNAGSIQLNVVKSKVY